MSRISVQSTFNSGRLWFANLAEAYQRNSTLIAVAFVFGVTRLLAALFTQMTFSGYGPTFGQFQTQGQFSLGGAYPFLQYWMEYPPLFPWLTVAAYRLSLLLPQWSDPTLWAGAWLRWILLPFEVGSLVLVYAIGRRVSSESGALRSTLFYAAAFVTLYVPLGWFDVLPLFWLLLVVFFTLRDQPMLTGLSAGLGLLAKPISVLGLPVAWQRWPNWRARVKLILAAIFSFALPMLPFVLLNPQMVWAHFSTLLNRSSWETVWALLDGYYSYGAVAPLAQRFDPATAAFQIHVGGGGYGLWATLGFAALGLYLWTRRINWRDPRKCVAFVGLTWSLFSLWSRGYSPQWAITFVPFIVLLMPNLRGAVYLGLLGIVLVAEWPVAFTLASNQQWFLIAIIIWRTLLFALLAIEMGAIALTDSVSVRLRAAYWSAITALVVAGGVIAGRATDGYVQYRLANEPLRATIAALQKNASPADGLVCREVAVCERIQPFIPGLESFWLPSDSSWQAANLSVFARKHPVIWLVEEYHEDTGHDVSIEIYLGERYGKVSQEWVEGTRLSKFTTSSLGQRQTVNVTFGNNVRLTSYAIGLEGDQLSVSLDWQAVAPLTESYKVFLHVRNASGEFIAQNDQYPMGGFLPTNQWVVGQTVSDLHGLILTGPLPAGSHLEIGLYDPTTNQRLILSDGSGADSFEIDVEVVAAS